jgi:hypothetical protein
MNPWEKYASQSAAPEVPPWEKYSAAPKEASGLEKLPPAAGAPQNPAAKPEHADSIANRLLGFGEAGASLATGAIGGAAGQLAGIGKTLTGGKFGTPQGAQEGERAGVELANKLTYQPRTQTGQELVQGAGRAMEASRLAGLPVEGGMLSRIGEVPRSALAAGEGLADVNRAVARTATAPARALTKKAINALPDLDPETKQLARDAHSMGFRLNPDQVYGNKYAKQAGELASDNPLIKTNREHNQKVFNQQLVNQIGGTGDKLTRKTFGEATQRVGSGIGALNEKYDLPIDRSFVPRLRVEARGQSPEVASAVNYFAKRIAQETQGGNLNGTVFRRINTELNNRISKSSNGDLKYALGEVQSKLLDLQQKQMSPVDKAQLQTLRRQYAIQRTIEPLVAKSPTGDVAPAALLGVVTATKAGKAASARGAAGDLGKLADIGQKFLKPQPSSGTAERSLMQNLLTHPLGTLAAGGTAAATAPLAAGYQRLGPQVTEQLINRPPVP